MKISTNDLSKKSPYIIDESTYQLHEYKGNITQYQITRKGLYIVDLKAVRVYGYYYNSQGYETSEQIAFGNYNCINYKSNSDIQVLYNATPLAVSTSHNYHKLVIANDSSIYLRIIAKYY